MSKFALVLGIDSLEKGKLEKFFEKHSVKDFSDSIPLENFTVIEEKDLSVEDVDKHIIVVKNGKFLYAGKLLTFSLESQAKVRDLVMETRSLESSLSILFDTFKSVRVLLKVIED